MEILPRIPIYKKNRVSVGRNEKELWWGSASVVVLLLLEHKGLK